MAPRFQKLLRPSAFALLLGALCSLTPACVAPPSSAAPTAALLINGEEQFESEILQGRQRVVTQFELVDGVTPSHRVSIDGNTGHWVPSGPRRLQFRVYLPAVGWNNGRGREARAAVDVVLQAQRRYRLTGDFGNGIRHFHLIDVDSGEPVTAPIDVGFFAPVVGPKGIPLLIPLGR